MGNNQQAGKQAGKEAGKGAGAESILTFTFDAGAIAQKEAGKGKGGRSYTYARLQAPATTGKVQRFKLNTPARALIDAQKWQAVDMAYAGGRLLIMQGATFGFSNQDEGKDTQHYLINGVGAFNAKHDIGGKGKGGQGYKLELTEANINGKVQKIILGTKE